MLYTFEEVNSWVEYPQTNPDQPIEYLFCHDPDNWHNPVHNSAYYLGEPSGRTLRGHEVENPLLIDLNRMKVPCVVAYSTCKSSPILSEIMTLTCKVYYYQVKVQRSV